MVSEEFGSYLHLLLAYFLFFVVELEVTSKQRR